VPSDPKQPAAVPLVFPAADQNLSKSSQAALLSIATGFAKSLRKALPFLARQHARTVVGPTARSSEGSLAELHPGPGFFVKLRSASGFWAALHFDSAAVLALVEGTFGAARPAADDDGAGEEAPDEGAAPALGETLTLAQRALLRRLCGDIALSLRTPLSEQCQIELGNPEFFTLRRDEAAPLHEESLAVDCQIENVRKPWGIRLSIGASGLASLAAKEVSMTTTESAFDAAALRIPVSIVAELGRVTLKLSQVLGLRVGDTLRLPSATNDPVLVRVEGVPKFEAVPVISRGQVAVKIHARYEE
jgi:flagellar motor switch/type III secretory pathway protein FliN